MKDGKVSPKRLVDDCGLLRADLVGAQFGSLTIVSRKTQGTSWRLLVEVKCLDCGTIYMGRYHNMRKRPNTRACPKCTPRIPVKVPKWLYRRCQSQKDRCQNEESPSYRLYGARGIEFRFSSSNEAAQWIADNLGIHGREWTIDRINNMGHYEPGNLRWANNIQQQNNTRRNRGSRERLISFRENHPEIRYADATLQCLVLRMTDEEIIARWNRPSFKPKGKYGTFSMQGLYRGSPQTIASSTTA
jgi:predicted RNA-binding Zn-ribbon protein involved in translation (DUF1610 family)